MEQPRRSSLVSRPPSRLSWEADILADAPQSLRREMTRVLEPEAVLSKHSFSDPSSIHTPFPVEVIDNFKLCQFKAFKSSDLFVTNYDLGIERCK